jgi:hypothetical protein
MDPILVGSRVRAVGGSRSHWGGRRSRRGRAARGLPPTAWRVAHAGLSLTTPLTPACLSLPPPPASRPATRRRPRWRCARLACAPTAGRRGPARARPGRRDRLPRQALSEPRLIPPRPHPPHPAPTPAPRCCCPRASRRTRSSCCASSPRPKESSRSAPGEYARPRCARRAAHAGLLGGRAQRGGGHQLQRARVGRLAPRRPEPPPRRPQVPRRQGDHLRDRQVRRRGHFCRHPGCARGGRGARVEGRGGVAGAAGPEAEGPAMTATSATSAPPPAAARRLCTPQPLTPATPPRPTPTSTACGQGAATLATAISASEGAPGGLNPAPPVCAAGGAPKARRSGSARGARRQAGSSSRSGRRGGGGGSGSGAIGRRAGRRLACRARLP